MSNKRKLDWSKPKITKWFWVIILGLVAFFIIMGIKWAG